MVPVVTPGDAAIVAMQMADLHCWAQVTSDKLQQLTACKHDLESMSYESALLTISPEWLRTHGLLPYSLATGSTAYRLLQILCRQGLHMSKS